MKISIIDSGIWDCEECNGRGFDFDVDGRFTCPFCKGAGVLRGEPVHREVEVSGIASPFALVLCEADGFEVEGPAGALLGVRS